MSSTTPGRTVTPTPPEAQEAAAASRAPDETKPLAPLFAPEACEALWRSWDEIQAAFVDEPRRAVEKADALVTDTMARLTDTFAHERTALEQQWGRGGEASTEDLRLAFRRYRAFFERLLSV